ncbi:N-acyl homoserine lactonase family protein [Variovorax sp. E3]|uniref:N-acyl homoserine lactonase family protein n=1 Tax=Variovorax sp. E3 TaxID=1914993 RepID=UPI0018DE9CB9|nr:N-acyl homoserine lactonase family protein [Variovorax sp. E3]
MPAQHEIYALRYATVHRKRRDNFIVADAHEADMPMDYYVWLIRRGARCWLVDTGFNASAAAQRKRTMLRCPIDSLQHLGIASHQVNDVLVTHLHYDHAGNLDKLPTARIHVQERELQYATGRCMRHDVLRHAYAVDDVVQVVRSVYDKRVDFYDGDHEVGDGVQLVHLGGHTAGLQAIRVFTARGWVVLASDASHFYANALGQSPFPIVHHVGDMLDAYGRLMSLCESPDHFIPGHDPLVLQRFPRHGDPGHEIVRLHEAPLAPLPLL